VSEKTIRLKYRQLQWKKMRTVLAHFNKTLAKLLRLALEYFSKC